MDQCCIKCFKFLKGKKKHYCRRCGELVCGKCSKNKRREPEYQKLVRVCDVCVERDEIVCQIQSRPFGLSMTPLQGTNDSLGALIIKVKPNSSAYAARVKVNCVIIELNNENIEHLTYKQVVERLHGIQCPFKVRLKHWNENTKVSAKEKLKERLTTPTMAGTSGTQSVSVGSAKSSGRKSKPGSARRNNRNRNDSNEDSLQMFGVSQSHTSPASNKFATTPDDNQSNNNNNNNNNRYYSNHNRLNSNTNGNSSVNNNSLNNSRHLTSNSLSIHRRNESGGSNRSHSRQDSGNSVSYEDSFISQNSEEKMDQPPHMISESNATLSLDNNNSFDASTLENYQEFIQNGIKYENSKNFYMARDCYDKAINFIQSKLIEFRDAISDEQYSNYNKLVGDWKVKLLRLEKKVKHQRRLERENSSGGGSSYRKSSRGDSGSYNGSSSRNRGGKRSRRNPSGNGNGGGDDSKSNKKDKDPDSAFRTRLEADIVADLTGISFQDVQGLENVKLALYETVILPQRRPELFTGLRSPGMGILLFGPPGNGKTMIAKCVAAQCNSTFFSISASSITSKFVGEAERIMRTLFSLAREKAPSIIFIDEIDSMLTARGGKNEAESSRRIKTEFLIQFDGVHNSSELNASLLVIGATNLPQQLDEAVLRRFSKRILVPHPERNTRYGLLRHLMSKENHQLSEGDFQKVSKYTDRYSCSDIRNLCADASMGPVRDLGANLANKDLDVSEIPKISLKHFESAMKNVRSSLSKESLQFYNEWNKKFGSKFNLQNTDLPKELAAKEIPLLED